MHKFRVPAYAALMLAIAGCSSNSDLLLSVRVPGSVRLSVGSSAAIVGTPWRVKFDSVISDSRCPLGVLCIQAGEALLALELTSPVADSRATGNSGPTDNPHFTLGTTPTTVEGLQFSQAEVLPIQRQGVQIDRRTYLVTLTIESGTCDIRTLC